MGSKDHSFDVVFKVDLQEVTNAVEQARKEIATRYDFKDSRTSLNWIKAEDKIELHTDSEFRLRSVMDILQTKFVKRGVPLTAIEPLPLEKATGGTVRQTIKISQGIPIEKAREIVKTVKESKLKVQAQIQGDEVRIVSVKIDTLQEAIQVVKSRSFGLELQFVNFR